MKGKIEREYPREFDVIKQRLFAVWDASKGVYSDVFYNDNGHTLRRFLFDSFYATRIKIADGVGIKCGDVTLTGTARDDDKLYAAFKSAWAQYANERPTYFEGTTK